MGKTTTTSTICGRGHGHGDDDVLFLPEDFFIQEILVCLPVKSLLRFKSVCKSWRELIDSSFFIDLHTSFNSSSSSSSKFGGTFILQTTEPSCEKYEDDIKLYMLSSGSGDHAGGEDEDEDDQKKKKMGEFKVDDLGFSPFYKDFQLHDSLRMVGSCNGIICLHDPDATDISRGGTGQHYSNLRDVYLWNPATRQFRILPKSIPIEEKQSYMGNGLEDFIGFGFDVKTKDYKVLRITPWEVSEEGGCMCRVQVYSLSTDSWRLLEGINSLPVTPNQEMFHNSGIYLNGSYFFGGIKSGTATCIFMLLSFDFTKEIFTTMQLPDSNSHVLSSLGEKLAVFTAVPQIDDGYWYYDIRVLNEQQGSSSSSQGFVNNESSWTKLHYFRIERSRGPSDDPKLRYAYMSHTEPRCISNNGEFVLISTGTAYDNDGFSRNKLQLFNLITKQAEKDFTIGTRQCRTEVYQESLVSIMGCGNVE